jgi:putative flavoprotein involved in K+ transport
MRPIRSPTTIASLDQGRGTSQGVPGASSIAQAMQQGEIMSSERIITERVQTVVIGGGQSGLSVGYHLARRGLPFVILDANARVGDTWRRRWESLRLFTPARYDGLAGMPFPASRYDFPTKDAMADYLESYAQHFKLPVRSGVRVDRLTRRGGKFLIAAGLRQFEADQVVVAMSSYQVPKTPAFAKELDPRIVQLHSLDYRTPQQLQDGDVLLVGAGNSAAEIAIEATRGHRTWMSGRDTGQVPFNVRNPVAQRFLLPLLFRVVFHRILTVKTPMGRKARPGMISKGTPLIRTRSKELEAAGVTRVPRVQGVQGGKPVLEDGRVLDVANVIWCTGFDHGMSWIDLPIFEADGEPRHEAGVVASEPGLYFVGLHFLYSLSSTMIHGIARDADRIAGAVATAVKAHGHEQVGVQAVAAAS